MSLGFLRAAWRPGDEVCVVRAIVRQREVLLVEQASTSPHKLRNIVTAELVICVLSSEGPLHGFLKRVSRLLPRIDFRAQQLPARNAAVQALAAEDTNLDFGH